MHALPELQRRVMGALFEREDAAELVRANGLSGARRLQIYRNNLSVTLSEALRAVYPVILRLVGDGFFAWAAHEYVRSHPSRSGNVQDFGDGYADHLAALPGAAELPYLADVARLEWAWHEVWHARAAAPLDLQRLAELPPETLPAAGLAFQPAARLLASPHPILRIWQANQPESDEQGTIDLAEGPSRVLVVQRALDVELGPLGAGEYALLAALAHGDCLAVAVGAALDAEPGLDVQASLAHHIRAATLTEIRLPA